MQFNIVMPGTNTVVMGPLGRENVYIRAYPRINDGRSIDDLKVGEHVEAIYSLSGSKGTAYWIVRIS